MKKQTKNSGFRVKPNLPHLKTKNEHSSELPLQKQELEFPDSPKVSFPSKDYAMAQFLATFQQLIKKTINKRSDLEVRDRYQLIEIPQGISYRSKRSSIKNWLQKVVTNSLSIGFNYYSKEEMNYEQFKVFCSENILKNVAAFTHKYSITAGQFKEIDQYLRDEVITLLLKKYPLAESIVVNRQLDELARAPDTSKDLENDFLYQNGVEFGLRDSENYDDLVKTTVNKIINKTNQVSEMDAAGNYAVFKKAMKGLFQLVEDKQIMETPKDEKRTVSANFQEKNQKTYLKKEETAEEREYREKVKQYTCYLIGKKIPQSVAPYSKDEIESRQFQIKGPSVLRILTKWCEQLWQKFIPKNYYLNKKGSFLLQNREVKNLSSEMASNLDKLMKDEKSQIKQFMQKLINESYQTQLNLLKQLLENTQDEFWQQTLQKASGKFSVLIGMSLQKWIIRYLNRLIHGLLKVASTFYDKYLSQDWPCPPNLLTFGIGDLMRCKCSSQQREILRIFQQLRILSEYRPQLLKVIRIKNRLNSGTNDILINVRFAGSMTCEIQLAVNSKKSKFIKASNGVSHYLYQIQRSLFGPFNELCSIQRSLDLRSSYYSKQVNSDQKMANEAHKCQVLKKQYDFQLFANPFICSVCTQTYSENNLIFDHLKCSECSYWKCGRCHAKSLKFSQLKSKIFKNEELAENCLKRFERKFETDQLPEYGLVISIMHDQKSGPIIYKRFVLKQVSYLFYIQQNGIQLLHKLETDKKVQQFLKNYMVFELSEHFFSEISELSIQRLKIDYFLPQYVQKCYSQQKKEIIIQKEALQSPKMQTIFKGITNQTIKIVSLTLAQTLIDSIEPLVKLFPNLQHLKLIKNYELKSVTGIKQLRKLKSLQINKCCIEQFPSEVTSISNLIVLQLKNCNFQSIPQDINRLKQLRELDFSKDPDFQLQPCFYFDTSIKSLPVELFELINLQKIELSYNSIYQIPAQIKKLKKLRCFRIKHNCVHALPSELFELKQIQELDVTQNPIEILPNSISGLKNVRIFNFFEKKCRYQENQSVDYFQTDLKKLPTDLQEITNLRALNVHSQELQSVPSLKLSRNLQTIDLQKCALGSFFDLGLSQNLKYFNFKGQNPKNPSILTIPENLFNSMLNLQYLNLSSNTIQKIPESIGKLTKLKYLNLQINSIKHLPGQLEKCVELKNIKLFANKIEQLPRVFARMCKLEKVDFSQNGLKEFEVLVGCKRLKEVLLTTNQITCIPAGICQLTNLEILDLEKNLITEVPGQMSQLKKLRKGSLFLDKNPIFYVQCVQFVLQFGHQMTKNLINELLNGIYCPAYYSSQFLSIKQSIKKADFLTKITINDFKLKQLPSEFGDLIKLREISLIKNQFKVFPQPITRLQQLFNLDLSENVLTSISENIGSLVSLKTLNLSNNQLAKLPISLKNCRKLTTIYLQSNSLETLDESLFDDLQQLEKLDLESNKLQRFPQSLVNCCKLKEIYMGANMIKDLGGLDFSKFEALKTLHLQSNRIELIPYSLSATKSFSKGSLNLNGNPIKTVQNMEWVLEHSTLSTVNQLKALISD